MTFSATAIAFPNIAFIKYWGLRDARLHLPTNGSISMNLAGLTTRTRVTFDPNPPADTLSINGKASVGPAQQRVSAFLDRVRQIAKIKTFASVVSDNNFPTGTGIASSASAFAALSLAASAAAGLHLNEAELSRLARTGSGSACRSVPGGFVEWRMGHDDLDSHAYSIAPPDHWRLVDCVVIVSQAHKPTGSIEGHRLAPSSPLHLARTAKIPHLLAECRRAIEVCDFDRLAQVTELDCHLMHAVMMTSSPRLLYWQPATLAVLHAVQQWRKEGTPVCYTIDAGPNVHVITTEQASQRIEVQLAELPGVQRVLTASPGGPVHLIDPDT
jgi:diphosphomevalonate decarboxylase